MLHCQSGVDLNPLTPASDPAEVLCIFIYIYTHFYIYIFMYTHRDWQEYNTTLHLYM